MEERNELLKLAKKKGLSNAEKVDLFIKLSNTYSIEGDYSEALKYAAMATISTYSPRADACCCIGDIYLKLSNGEWAIKWYKNAMSSTTEGCNPAFSTWIPLIKISQAYLLVLNIDKAEEYVSAAEKFTEENEEVEQMKNSILTIKETLKQQNSNFSQS